MGICASIQLYTNNKARMSLISWPISTVQVISFEGKLQEYKQPVKASQVLSLNPNYFLCSSECMFVGSTAPQLGPTEELQQGQIYFLLPVSRYSKASLSLQDLCALAIKASAALSGPVRVIDGFQNIDGAFQRVDTVPILPKA